jgi:ectoine hydroxylase-related dioxygenase (phytanoyl-CoA dioxygenase family)
LTDQNQTTGGLIVYPRTHLRFNQLIDIVKKNKSTDFVKIPNTHSIMNQGQTMSKLVHCQRGDLVLWDSHTIHCNSPAVPINERNTDEPVDLLRMSA